MLTTKSFLTNMYLKTACWGNCGDHVQDDNFKDLKFIFKCHLCWEKGLLRNQIYIFSLQMSNAKSGFKNLFKMFFEFIIIIIIFFKVN